MIDVRGSRKEIIFNLQIAYIQDLSTRITQENVNFTGFHLYAEAELDTIHARRQGNC